MELKSELLISPTMLYGLGDICTRYSIDPFDMLGLAAHGEIDLCIPLPAGTRLYHYPREFFDELPLDLDIERFVNFGASTKNSLTRPFPAQLGALAVSIHPEYCSLISAYGMSRIRTFHSAYRIAMPEKTSSDYSEDIWGIRFAPCPSYQPYSAEMIFGHQIDPENTPDDVLKKHRTKKNEKWKDRIVNAVFVLLPTSDSFPEGNFLDHARPIEIRADFSSLHIFGSVFLRYIEEWHSTLYKNDIESKVRTEIGSDAVVVKSSKRDFPPPIKNFAIPKYAPEIIKELYAFNIQHWSSFDAKDDQTACKEHSDRGVEILEIKFSKKKSPLRFSDAEAVMAIMKPLWAWPTNIPDRAKHQRLSSLNSPFLEKIVLVLEELHAEGLLGKSSSGSRSSRKEEGPGSKGDIANRLSSPRHIDLSRTYMAPVAVRMLLQGR